MNKTKLIKLAQEWRAISEISEHFNEQEAVCAELAEHFKPHSQLAFEFHTASFAAAELASELLLKAMRAANEEPRPKGQLDPCCSMEQFEEFWKLYPRKRGKGAAKKKYLLISEEKHEAILQSLQSHIKEWAGVEEQFIPHPTTWLNGERWEDEIKTIETKYNTEAADSFDPYTA